MRLAIRLNGRTVAFGLSLRDWRVQHETFRGRWGTAWRIWQFGPLWLVVDSLPATTVGERGVW